MIVAEGAIQVLYKLFTKTFLKIFESTYPNTLEAMKTILGNADGS